MADEHEADVGERLAAMGADFERVGDPARLLDPEPGALGAGPLGRQGQPVSALNRPRNDVLESAEGGSACAGRLLEAPAVLALDRAVAP